MNYQMRNLNSLSGLHNLRNHQPINTLSRFPGFLNALEKITNLLNVPLKKKTYASDLIYSVSVKVRNTHVIFCKI